MMIVRVQKLNRIVDAEDRNKLHITFGLGEVRIVAFRLPELLLIFYLKFKIKFFDE